MAKKRAGGKRGARENGRAARGRRWALSVLLLALLALGGLAGWMRAQDYFTRLCPAEVYLPDLPRSFDGATALYISDLNLRDADGAADFAKLLKKLAPLNVDMLLLGGDYLRGDASAATLSALSRALADFPARMGKFAVRGESDAAAGLADALADAGVALLEDGCATIKRDGEQLIIAGLSDASTGKTPYTELGGYFDGGECVLVLAHNPKAYVGVRVAEARGGGAWADVVLSGHNLGGQIRAFGRTLHTLPDDEARTLAGWFYGDDLPLLVSQGLSCPNVSLRLGARSEIWLLTLRRPRAAEEWQRESAAQGPAGEVTSTQNPTNAPDAGGLPDVAAMRAAQEAPLDAGESASSAPLGAEDARGGAPDFFPEQISPAALPDLR